MNEIASSVDPELWMRSLEAYWKAALEYDKGGDVPCLDTKEDALFAASDEFNKDFLCSWGALNLHWAWNPSFVDKLRKLHTSTQSTKIKQLVHHTLITHESVDSVDRLTDQIARLKQAGLDNTQLMLGTVKQDAVLAARLAEVENKMLNEVLACSSGGIPTNDLAEDIERTLLNANSDVRLQAAAHQCLDENVQVQTRRLLYWWIHFTLEVSAKARPLWCLSSEDHERSMNQFMLNRLERA